VERRARPTSELVSRLRGKRRPAQAQQVVVNIGFLG